MYNNNRTTTVNALRFTSDNFCHIERFDVGQRSPVSPPVEKFLNQVDELVSRQDIERIIYNEKYIPNCMEVGTLYTNEIHQVFII